jgi:hypothetical protein
MSDNDIDILRRLRMFKKKKLYKITFVGSCKHTVIVAARDDIHALRVFYRQYSAGGFYKPVYIEPYSV